MKNMALLLEDRAFLVASDEEDKDVLVTINKESLPIASAVPGRWIVRKTNPKARTSYCLTTIQTGNTRRTIYLHRLILGTPPGMVTDHKDGNGLRNTKDNLESVTQAENLRRGRERTSRRSSKLKKAA